MYNILCIGSCSDVKQNRFTGQSVMFDGVINHLKNHGMGVSVVDISQKNNKNGVLFRTLDYLLILPKVFWKLIRNRLDICYITSSQSKNGFLRDYAMITMCRWFQVPVITHQYGANYNQLTNALGEKGLVLLKKMLNYTSVIIVEGQYMKNQYSFLDSFEKKVKVIPNGLPIVGKNAMQEKKYSPEYPFKMYYLSNLIWSKGYFDVLQAVELLVNKFGKSVECIFSGNFLSSVDDEKPGISNKEDFDKYIKKHHLEKVVSYYPGMYGDQKDETFATSNVFLLPSYYINEGQPVSIIEAMAYGCVPIVTNYRHIPMMVNPENGCFVKPQCPEQIAETIVQLMDHPAEYASKSAACIRDYKDNFTFEIYASKVLQCMNEVIKAR